MQDSHTDLFTKEESDAYVVREENSQLCKSVIVALYHFIEEQDAAMLDNRAFEKIRNKATGEYNRGRSKKMGYATVPRNIELVKAYREMVADGSIDPNEVVLSMIVKRKVRTLSGIANITVLMKDFGCPGKCVFCPTQPGMPKSYFSTQPAMMRAVRNDFNAYMQVKARLNGLHSQGHDVTKIDIRTAGGTWSSYPEDYQIEFLKGIYYALNEGVGDMKSVDEVAQILGGVSLEDLIEENETTHCRCVGLWVETRPDWVTIEELVRLRSYGVTGIELGVQTTDDDVNELCKRGHGLKESIEATKLCRNVGLKVCHHLMPNLPTSTVEKDIQSIVDMFDRGILNPDYIKIYPCMVVPYTELKEMVEKDPSIYTPYSDEELIEILAEIMKRVPEYCRIIRLLRDFPSELVLQGTKTLNIRQVMERRGIQARDVRAREIRDLNFNESDVELVTREYRANEGDEFFISFEDVENDKLIGLVRLRLSEEREAQEVVLNAFPELEGAALIRELHVYGQKKSLVKTELDSLDSKTQHVGYGRRLMAAAEDLARSQGFEKIAVISAIGTREYYKKLDYHLEGTYMVKKLH